MAAPVWLGAPSRQQFLSAQDYPFGAALAGVLIAAVGAVAVIVLLLSGGRRRVAT